MSSAPTWAKNLRSIIRGGARSLIRDVPSASAASQWAVLVELADLADDDGTIRAECEITYTSMGAQVYLSEDGARRAARALHAVGLVDIEERRGAPHRFRLKVENIEACELAPHRWAGRTPRTLQPVAPCNPSHGATPGTVQGEESHDATGTPRTVQPHAPHGATPLPYGLEGSDLGREDGDPPEPPEEAAPAAPPRARNDQGEVLRPRASDQLLQPVLPGIDQTAPTPLAKTRSTKPRTTKEDIPVDELTAREGPVYNAIVDSALDAIVAQPARLARELMGNPKAKGIDVVRVVEAAAEYYVSPKGQAKGYTDGRTFLLNQLRMLCGDPRFKAGTASPAPAEERPRVLPGRRPAPPAWFAEAGFGPDGEPLRHAGGAE
jgi:hypothetical protein